MNLEEQYGQLKERLNELYLTQLLDGVDAGDFSNIESIPETYTYRHLNALLYFIAGGMKHGEQYYEKIYNLVLAHGKAKIKEKTKNQEKIKIAFLVASSAQWPAEKVYWLMQENEKIDCYIVVCSYRDRDPKDAQYVFEKTYDFFVKKGYNVKKAYDFENDQTVTWEQNGGTPDVIVHISPWYGSFVEEYQIENLPLKCLNCYIPYGMYVSDNLTGDFASKYIYNKPFVNMLWRVYADSIINLHGYQLYGLLKGKNAKYSGYCKMDYFFEKKEFHEKELRKLWKMPEHKRPQEMKRVLIAPHHSVLDDMVVSYSTFHQNLYFLLYLAEKYKEEISFIYKPHPNLRHKSVQAGIFRDIDGYDAYVSKWDCLPNAKSVDEDDYLQLFASSDGMIMDSASFIAEYMYTNKPLLFLTKDTQAFNQLGKIAVENHYQAEGNDYYRIEKFLCDVILQGNDSKKVLRQQIFEEHLDYMHHNHCLASEYIYNDMITELEI